MTSFDEPTCRFQINGVNKTDLDYLVLIPIHYRDRFEGHNFPTLDCFKRALMFANCASEARYYGRPWLVEQNERELEHQLERRA